MGLRLPVPGQPGCGDGVGRRDVRAAGHRRQPAHPRQLVGISQSLQPAGSGLLAALLALLTRITIGRTAANDAGKLSAADLEASGRKLWATHAGKAIRHYLTPWTGCALVVLVFAVLALRWSLDGAVMGISHQFWPVVIAALIGVLSKLFISVNRTSMHRFYRERLASAYGVTRRGYRVRQPNASDSTDVRPADPGLLLSSLDPAAFTGTLPAGFGLPELVICAAANVTGSGVPTGRGAISFAFTPVSSGLAVGRAAMAAPAEDSRGRARRAPTVAYETYCGPQCSGSSTWSPCQGRRSRRSWAG